MRSYERFNRKESQYRLVNEFSSISYNATTADQQISFEASMAAREHDLSEGGVKGTKVGPLQSLLTVQLRDINYTRPDSNIVLEVVAFSAIPDGLPDNQLQVGLSECLLGGHGQGMGRWENEWKAWDGNKGTVQVTVTAKDVSEDPHRDMPFSALSNLLRLYPNTRARKMYFTFVDSQKSPELHWHLTMGVHSMLDSSENVADPTGEGHVEYDTQLDGTPKNQSTWHMGMWGWIAVIGLIVIGLAGRFLLKGKPKTKKLELDSGWEGDSFGRSAYAAPGAHQRMRNVV